MAQGAPKSKPKSTAPSAAKKTTSFAPKKTTSAIQKPRVVGPRLIAPKKSSVVAKQRNTVAKRAAGLTGLMEQQLAKRAGYTEMIGGAKGAGGVRRADREAGDKVKGGKRGWKSTAGGKK